jgi:hypothetical protein
VVNISFDEFDTF